MSRIIEYTKRVEINYYQSYVKAYNAIEEVITSITSCYDQIISNPDYIFDEERSTRWQTLLDTLKNKKMELQEEMDKKYSEMIERAEEYDRLFERLVAKVGTTEEEGYGHENDSEESQPSDAKTYKMLNATNDGEGYPAIEIERITTPYIKSTDGDHNWKLGNQSVKHITISIQNEDEFTNYIDGGEYKNKF